MANWAVERFIDRLLVIPGIMRCEMKDEATLDVWVEYVKEAGRLLRVTIDGSSVFCRDAPAALFARMGYAVSRGEDVCLASYALAGQLGESYFCGPNYSCDDDFGDNDYGIEACEESDSELDRDLVRKLTEEQERLLQSYLDGDQAKLAEMLRNLILLRNALGCPWWSEQSVDASLPGFLERYPAIAWHWINWFVERPFDWGQPHQFCWNDSGEWFWADGGTPALKARQWMEDITPECRPPVYRVLFHAGSERQIQVANDDPHRSLAGLLVEDDDKGVRQLVTSGAWRKLFSDETSMPPRRKGAGSYCGLHYTMWISAAQRLRQIGEDRAAELLLLKLVDAVEAEARETNGDVASWYYDQLRIIYKKRKDYQREVDIIKRHIEWHSKSRDRWGPEHSKIREQSIAWEQTDLAKALARLKASK